MFDGEDSFEERNYRQDNRTLSVLSWWFNQNEYLAAPDTPSPAVSDVQ